MLDNFSEGGLLHMVKSLENLQVITLSLRNVTAAIARQLLAVSSSAAIWMECPDFDNPKIRASDLQEIEARYPTLGYFRLLVATSVFGIRRLLWPT